VVYVILHCKITTKQAPKGKALYRPPRHSRNPPRKRYQNSQKLQQWISGTTGILHHISKQHTPLSEGIPYPNLIRRYNMSEMKSLYKKCVNDENTWPHCPTDARTPGTRYTTIVERLYNGIAIDDRSKGGSVRCGA
jgi:hypothetical protein